MNNAQDHNWKEPLLGEIADAINGSLSGKPLDLNGLSLQLAQLHYQKEKVFRGLSDIRLGGMPRYDEIEKFSGVPDEAFKRCAMHTDPERVVKEFLTSGTSRGEKERGRSLFSGDDLALMDTAITAGAVKYLFPDYRTLKTRILILAPEPSQAPQMIMAYGMDFLRRHFGTDESCFLVGSEGLDIKRFFQNLNEVSEDNEPATIIGATFGFVHLIDGMKKSGIRFSLPEGSRLMDAGGFKGKSREVSRARLLEDFNSLFGIKDEMCVNLLGMTEHASQFYEDSIAAHFEKRARRRGKQNSPWTRTWAVDPETLRKLPHGEKGLLLHLDLANGGHPFLVQTYDMGITYPDGFVILGRVAGSAARGCSISIDEMLGDEKRC